MNVPPIMNTVVAIDHGLRGLSISEINTYKNSDAKFCITIKV